MGAQPYQQDFYETIRDGAHRSARVVIPMVLQLVPAKAVIDIGCGEGTWLSVFRELGVSDVLGVDGDYVDPVRLQIPRHQFQAADLTKPFGIDRSFDLAVSLEVAEHLPPQRASNFVETLTRLAPVVLFSAAIPHQGGIHHLNEQWPDYWAALFKRCDYLPIDCIRGKIWDNDNVAWYYAQNLLLFAHESLIQNDEGLRREYERTHRPPFRLVHPGNYLRESGVREASYSLAKALKRSILWRVKRLH
jgi:SAM-dependent methyltransferase